MSKDAAYFLARAKKTDIKISWEHVGFEWMPFEEALKRLKHKNHQQLLEKTESYLNARR